MVDLRKWKAAPKLEKCPCGGTMTLDAFSDTYRCDKCAHFRWEPRLQDKMESDDPANIKICKCKYCSAGDSNQRVG